MRRLTHLVLSFALAAPLAFAGDAPPAGDGEGQRPGPPARGAEGRDRGDWSRRVVEQHPELKGVDLNTPEGQEKLREVMRKRAEENAPRMRERLAERQAERRAELKKELGMTDEEFAAVEPLLARVENLRMHRNLVDRGQGRGGPPSGRGGPPWAGGGMDTQLVLGDAPLDPSAAEIGEAVKALKALVDDLQANATELDLALARVRQAREGWQAAMTKAQEELRSVLSRRQEALLLDRGVIE